MNQDVLILGGGPAGAVAAIALARRGRRVTLIERQTAPKHKVCGEFLSAEALRILSGLGIRLPDSEGQGSSPAQEIHTVRLASAQYLTEARLPFPARSLTRRCLDLLLLQAAREAGASVVNASVEQLAPIASGWQVTLGTGENLTAPRAILATGKHDLRGFRRPDGRQNDLVALKMYFRVAPAEATCLQNTVELHLFPDAYAGLQPVEGGAANLTALVRKGRLAQLGGWPGFLAQLQETNRYSAQRLGGATPLLEKPLALSAIPYGFVRRRAIAPELYAVGDQAAVIPSFTGDGMSIALYTGMAAALAILEGEAATAFQRKVHAQLHGQVARATLLSQALLHPLARPLLTTAAHLWSGSLSRAASMTRLAEAALSSCRFA